MDRLLFLAATAQGGVELRLQRDGMAKFNMEYEYG